MKHVSSLLILLLIGCSLFKAKLDPVGKQYAVTIQQEAMQLVGKAGQSFSLHREAVYRLLTRVEQAYEHARQRYKNDRVTNLWNLMRDPQSNRLAHFMNEWEKEDILTDTYINEAKKSLQEDFKLLIKAEESKKK